MRLAMSQGLCRKQKLFSKKGRGQLTDLVLGPWASRRREELLKLLDQLKSCYCRVGPCGFGRSKTPRGHSAFDDPSGNRAGHFTGFRTRHRSDSLDGDNLIADPSDTI
jgi:hypothetical protein